MDCCMGPAKGPQDLALHGVLGRQAQGRAASLPWLSGSSLQQPLTVVHEEALHLLTCKRNPNNSDLT